MKNEIAKKILKMEEDKLMSEPESDRDWELITALEMAIKALEERLTGEWIPVSERLPIKDGQYICTFYNGNFVEVGELEYFNILGKFETVYYTDDYKVIAWMPLPEPYKENEDDNT